MQSGTHTVGDGMRRHLVTLERDRANLDQSIRLCARLTGCQEPFDGLDAGAVLEEMSAMEQTGTTFQNKQKKDVGIRYVAPVAITLAVVLLMGAFSAVLVYGLLFEASPMWPLVLAVLAVPLLIIAGVVYALVQRIREIGKGEEDDAKNY